MWNPKPRALSRKQEKKKALADPDDFFSEFGM